VNARIVQLDVLRYDPEADSEPRFQRYVVPCAEEWVVLDALNAIKESIDPTLNYRWSCHMAVCGSCGMMINGEPKLSCHAFLREYDGVIRVEPLANFPIERDLVVQGFVLRYKPEEKNVDGLPGDEGVFLPCSFWFATCLSMLGRKKEASDEAVPWTRVTPPRPPVDGQFRQPTDVTWLKLPGGQIMVSKNSHIFVATPIFIL